MRVGERGVVCIVTMYVSRPHRVGDRVQILLDNRLESALKKWKSALENVPSQFI